MAKNTINNKVYIGQTKQGLETRKKRHLQDSKTSNFIFHKAIKKYGYNKFEWIILEDNISIDRLNEAEKKYISQYKSQDRNYGYNMTEGGEENLKGNAKLTLEKVEEIIKLIINSKYTLKEIGTMYDMSIHAISDINRGKSWFNADLSYPLRKKNNNEKKRIKHNKYSGVLTREEIVGIISDLKDTYLTNTEIAKKYNCSKLSIASINNGKNLISREIENVFPIRKDKIDINNKIILNKEKIFSDISNPNILLGDIAKKYKISHLTIQKINNGELLHNSKVSYPLRNKTISEKRAVKLSINEVKEIIQILENTTISLGRIAKIYNVTKPCIRSINNGNTWSYLYEKNFPIRKHAE